MSIKLQSIITVLAFLVFSNTLAAQGISLSQLQSMAEMSNWEKVNQYISNKGWEYYSSEKGDDEHYDEITWTYEKSYYEDKAEGWFGVYAYDNKPQKVTYQAKKDIIIGIKNSLSGYGYTLKDSKIEDDYLTSTYENSKYIINLKTSSRNEDFAYNSVITYSLVLIKKEGIYDEDNGDRVQYWEGTSRIQTKYKLKNGELNGEATSYYANGQVELKGNWFNGEKSGRFEEYDEEGIKTYEYYTSNGKQNGEYIEYYSNGKVKKRGNYVNDKELGFFTEYNENGSKKIEYNMLEDQLNGTYISYYDSGQIRMNGVFKDGKKHGYFVEYDEYGVRMDEYNMENGISHGFFIFYLNDGKISQKGNHVKGKKSGLFSEYDKNSNLVITYEMENDKLHGIYKKYSNNEVVTKKNI
jgi:antitoxin component YwqK of YwqJK toxin-antitoxin module